MSNGPVKKFRCGYVTVNVWKNDGQERPFFTVDIQRTYKDDAGELKNTASLNHADVPVAVLLLQRAEEFISQQ